VMRLLKVDTLELHEYFEAQIPPYAILSHRWEDGEVSLQQLQSGEGQERLGYSKILNCCAQAAKDGWDYAVGASPAFLLFQCHSRTCQEARDSGSVVDFK
jgi:hypothetical protein